ncbi:MAG: hypothetical protein R6U61_00160 [Thermoplasmata archaeon]
MGRLPIFFGALISKTDYRYLSTFLNGEKVNRLATIGTPPAQGEPTPSDVYSYSYAMSRGL